MCFFLVRLGLIWTSSPAQLPMLLHKLLHKEKSEQAARLAERASLGGNAISCQITACKQVHPYFLT